MTSMLQLFRFKSFKIIYQATQLAFASPKLTIETVEQGVQYVQS